MVYEDMRIACLFLLMARWVFRLKIHEDHQTLTRLLKWLGEGRNPFVAKCFSLWALLEAKNLRDPYAVSAAYKIFFKFADGRKLQGRLVSWVIEAAFWTKDREIISMIGPFIGSGGVDFCGREELDWSAFLMWREGAAANHISPELLKKFSEGWSFDWIGLFMEGLYCEIEGDSVSAANKYRTAYGVTPPWLTESKMIRDRIRGVTNGAVRAGATET